MNKILAGFPNHTIDENGKVVSIKSGKVLSVYFAWGYPCVSIFHNKKNVKGINVGILTEIEKTLF